MPFRKSFTPLTIYPSRSLPPPSCSLSVFLSDSFSLSHALSLSLTHKHTHIHTTHPLAFYVLRQSKAVKTVEADEQSQKVNLLLNFRPKMTIQLTFEICFRMSSAPQCYGVNLELNLMHKRTIELPFENSWSLKYFTRCLRLHNDRVLRLLGNAHTMCSSVMSNCIYICTYISFSYTYSIHVHVHTYIYVNVGER